MSTTPTTPNMMYAISPEGEPYQLPVEKYQAAIGRGFKPAIQMTSPEGDPYWLPRENAAAALKKGFTVGKSSYSDLPSPMQAGMAGVGRDLKNTADDLITGTKGLVTGLNPLQQEGENAFTQIPAVRMLRGVVGALSGVTQVPGAISDINAGPDPTQSYADTVRSTAAQGLPGLLAGEFGDAGSIGNRAVKAGAQVLKETATPENIGTAVGGAIGGKLGGWTGGATGAAVGRAVGKAAGKVLGKGGEVPKPSIPTEDLGAITDPEAIKARVQDFLNRKQATQGDLFESSPEGKNGQGSLFAQDVPAESTAPKSETVGSKAAADNDTALFARAKAELGPDASLSQVAKKAQDFKNQAGEFEKTFGQPLSNYQDANGNFNMRDFLQEVVKPKTEPPAYVVGRVFGADGVKLLQDVSGKSIDKWEATGPTKAERAAKAPTKAEAPQAEASTAPDAKIISGDPRQYLKLVGADEKSVMQTPEDAKTVNFFRNKFRKGEPTQPVEVHLDENNNITGADGRHRALAAAKEGQQKIKIKVVRHTFEAVK